MEDHGVDGMGRDGIRYEDGWLEDFRSLAGWKEGEKQRNLKRRDLDCLPPLSPDAV